ncbi:hypothetical protein EBZ37_04470, partial [bacterium]|nr:hypothetical protein [bacterium]
MGKQAADHLMSNWKEKIQQWKGKLSDTSHRASERLRPWMEQTSTDLHRFIEKTEFRARLQEFLPKSWDWRSLLEWLSTTLQKRGATFYSTLLALIVSSFFLADLASLWVESKLPSSEDESSSIGSTRSTALFREEDFSAIWERNLFSSKGLIPGEATPGSGAVDQGGTPQPTTLPLNLVGTLILRDELKSIATIEDKSASLVYPVRIEDEIPSKIRIIQIQPRKVIFLNLGSGRREFVELPEDSSGSKVLLGQRVGGDAKQIERQGNNFNVPRLDLDRA